MVLEAVAHIHVVLWPLSLWGRQFIMEDGMQETAHITKSSRQREKMKRARDTDNLL